MQVFWKENKVTNMLAAEYKHKEDIAIKQYEALLKGKRERKRWVTEDAV